MVDKCQYTKMKKETLGLSGVTTPTSMGRKNKPLKEVLNYREMRNSGKRIF